MSSSHHHALIPGTRVENFQILRVLGVGGFGITYLARDLDLEREIALKEYFPSALAVRNEDHTLQAATEGDQEDYDYGLERFLDEARTLARFAHPSIVRVSRFLRANNTAYLVMDYEVGESLSMRLKTQVTLSERELLEIIIPLVDGLQQIHQQNYLHRDIKPANIFLREFGPPLLLDFGSARQALNDRAMTALITPGYAPYEQYFNQSNQGPWSDLYAIGATMYMCATGMRPKSAMDRAGAIKRDETDPVAAILQETDIPCSPELLKLILRLMDTDPALRPQSAGEVLQELQGLKQALPEEKDVIIDWDPAFLQAMETVLKENAVKDADALIEKASKDAHSKQEIAEIMTTVLASDEDRTEFYEKTRLLIPEPTPVSAELPLYQILKQSELCLAAIIGPRAGDIVMQAAQAAETRQDFYQRLLDTLEDRGQQVELLRGIREFESSGNMAGLPAY